MFKFTCPATHLLWELVHDLFFKDSLPGAHKMVVLILPCTMFLYDSYVVGSCTFIENLWLFFFFFMKLESDDILVL